MQEAVVRVFFYGVITALATGLGALPFLLVRQLSERVVASSTAIASGLMLGASAGLIFEGGAIGWPSTLIGTVFGAIFAGCGQHFLDDLDVHFGQLRGAGARRLLIFLMVMTLHSFAEGVAVGVAYGGGERLAILITAAIALHNVPEGLAISAVMRPQGASVISCAWWSIFSSLPQPLMAVPAFLFVDIFRQILPYGLGFAAGAMVAIVFLDLLPQTFSVDGKWFSFTLIIVSLSLMLLFQHLF